MQLTKKNHYNPCFWTAHWNTQYLERTLRGERNASQARNQRVFALSVKSNKIYSASVENVHYDKGMGVAEITPEAAKDFCRRHFPGEYEQFCREMDKEPEGLYCLDFESILSGLEATEAYTTLLDVIAKQRVDTPLEKAFLAGFILDHHFRSHAILNSMVELHQQAGIHKFEYFWMLKHFLSNSRACFNLVMSFAPGYWTFYRLDKDSFPLNDSPILISPQNIMVALSPRLLLEIDRTRQADESQRTFTNHISKAKLEEFRRRTIQNTFREIIFGSASLLEEWRSTTEFVERHGLMANVTSYNALVTRHEEGELWKLNAYGGSG